jgi:acyl-coenzyme A synthetase/AMP-(fatty) acid ligase
MVGRTDFHVKVRGVRTNTAEVEHVIQSHPDVLEAAVIAVPDGIEGNLLLAFIGRRTGSSLNSLTLRQVCARRLARTAIPTLVEISDNPLPKTSTGKIDRNALRLQYLKG